MKSNRRIVIRACLGLLSVPTVGNAFGADSASSGWVSLATGVEYRTLAMGGEDNASDELHVVRVDASRARLTFGLASQDQGANRTAAQWCADLKAVVVINAGMFQQDHLRNVGRLVHGSHTNNRSWNEYRSALVFDPRKPLLPAARLLDLDAPDATGMARDYASVVQNLRLIKAPGLSVWKPNAKAWSESAVAQDRQGRILFLFSRHGHEMATWNRYVLSLPLDLAAAMHVEGGPEASLSLCTTSPPLHLSGSFETGFHPHDTNQRQWPVPNVLAVVAADSAH